MPKSQKEESKEAPKRTIFLQRITTERKKSAGGHTTKG